MIGLWNLAEQDINLGWLVLEESDQEASLHLEVVSTFVSPCLPVYNLLIEMIFFVSIHLLENWTVSFILLDKIEANRISE